MFTVFSLDRCFRSQFLPFRVINSGFTITPSIFWSFSFNVSGIWRSNPWKWSWVSLSLVLCVEEGSSEHKQRKLPRSCDYGSVTQADWNYETLSLPLLGYVSGPSCEKFFIWGSPLYFKTINTNHIPDSQIFAGRIYEWRNKGCQKWI